MSNSIVFHKSLYKSLFCVHPWSKGPAHAAVFESKAVGSKSTTRCLPCHPPYARDVALSMEMNFTASGLVKQFLILMRTHILS